MNIFIHETKQFFLKTAVWTFTIILVSIAFFSVYPAVSEQSEQILVMLEGFPPFVFKALGAILDMFFSLNGFYGFFFVYVTIFGSMLALNLGISVVSKEATKKTCEFLLTKPVRRSTVLFSKLFAVVFLIALSNAAFIPVVYNAALQFSNSFNKDVFFLITFSLPIVQLLFLSLGFFVGSIAKKVKSPASASSAIVFFFFAVLIINNLSNDKIIKYISFFKYFDPTYIIMNKAYSTQSLFCTAFFVVLFLASSFAYYMKKDIHI